MFVWYAMSPHSVTQLAYCFPNLLLVDASLFR
jgi:hypothetical protein